LLIILGSGLKVQTIKQLMSFTIIGHRSKVKNMIEIKNIIEKLYDELNTHENIDQYVYDLIQEIEVEIQQPIKIYRNESRYIFDVQPDFPYKIIDVEENEKKVINLAKLTE